MKNFTPLNGDSFVENETREKEREKKGESNGKGKKLDKVIKKVLYNNKIHK